MRCLLLLGAILSVWISASAQTPETRSVTELFALAYTRLPENPSEAARLFEEIIQRQPENTLALRQVGSIYINLGRYADALSRFQRANTLTPSDTLRLQIAYLLNSTGDFRGAYSAFTDLRGSSDPGIRQTARGGAVVLGSMLRALSYPWWSKLYAAPYYDTRFKNLIFTASLYGGYHLTSKRSVSLYGTAAITRDTRSVGGSAPVIYSDNYLLFGGGLRLQPFTGLIADLQAGAAFDIDDRPGSSSPRSDFRAVASYGNGWFPDIHVPSAPSVTCTPFADLFLSAGGYSRYKNGIGYLQARAGIRFFEFGYSAMDVYLRGDAAGDTRHDYFNNIIEVGGGVRFTPDHRWGLQLLAEYHRGGYAGGFVLPAGVDRYYSSVRIFLVVDRFFRL